jgi:hypothetical protein
MTNLVKKMFIIIEIYYIQLKTTIVDKYKLKMTFYLQVNHVLMPWQ